MKREHRSLTRREWTELTSRRPVVRRISPPPKDAQAGKVDVEMSFALAEIRYARSVLRESRGEKSEEVLEALRELGND